MTSRQVFWQGVERALADGRSVFLGLVVASTAHSPGTAGAAFFVDSAGESSGTIGGGVMELRVMERARMVLAAGERVAEIVDLRHRREVGAGEERSGMICAGRQTNLYLTLRGERDRAAVESWLGALSCEVGSLRLSSQGLEVAEEGGGSLRARLVRGSAWRYEEPALERRRLAILGGGHCGLALARMMTGLGWRVTIWETRPDLDLGEPGAVGIEMRCVEDFREAGPTIDHAALTPVIVMTTDVDNDSRALEGVLRGSFPLIGAMGSSAKLVEIRRRLAARGFSDDELERLTAPVGLPIDSDTPQEIAVSVAAQILSLRQGWLAAEVGE